MYREEEEEERDVNVQVRCCTIHYSAMAVVKACFSSWRNSERVRENGMEIKMERP